MPSLAASQTYRPVRLWEPRIEIETRADGSKLVRQAQDLDPYPARLSDRILHWAETTPDRCWIAQRDIAGAWRKVTYQQSVDQIRSAASALLDLSLSLERPLLILSGNSLEHAIVALSAQYVGVPSAAITPNYSLLDSSFGKLQSIAEQITPGAVFVQDAELFGDAIENVFDRTIPIIHVTGGPPSGRPSLLFEDLVTHRAAALADKANSETGPDTVAKFLFTSGTTGSPKAVIQTQRMLCSNMEMVRDCFRYVDEDPPVLVDWAPWSHVASGNMVFNFALYNGGTYYIDEGKPAPSEFGKTIENLRDISPTWYFNVPVGFDLLCDAMEEDPTFAANFFRNLKIMMYAGAGMASHTWRRLSELSQRTLGKQVLLCTGLGATETAPFVLFCTEPQDEPGNVGIPMRGLSVKLVPTAGKLELRVKGPSVTPGYWRQPDLTEKAFDEEGFFNMGDAVRPAHPKDWARGFMFDGRTAENFKLDTGTWVAVGSVRSKLINSMEGLIRDAAICGENKPRLGALLIPAREAIETLIEGGESLSDNELYAHPKVRSRFTALLTNHNRSATGSSNRVTRALLVTDPLDVAKGEVTEKGSLNQKALVANRPWLLDELYGDGPELLIPVR